MAACPTWAAWAGWTCKVFSRKQEKKRARKGPFLFVLPLVLNCLGGGQMRILVAEDDAILAEGVMQTLRHSGYAVDRVKNGAEAESALAANQFDLLILDLGLPVKSGLEV